MVGILSKLVGKGVSKARKSSGPKQRRKVTSKPLSAKEKQSLAEKNKRFKKLMEGTVCLVHDATENKIIVQTKWKEDESDLVNDIFIE